MSRELTTKWTEAELFTAAARRLTTRSGQTDHSPEIGKTVRALARLGSRGSREVVLELPKDIASGLLRGTLKRTGGVIRDCDGKIVLHLKDISTLKKLLKGAALPLMLLDFAEGALLNAKLQQIEQQLSAIADKIEAQHKAILLLPFEKARRLVHLTSESSKERELAATQDATEHAVALSRQRLRSACVRIDEANRKFEKKRYQGKAREAVFMMAQEILEETQLCVALLLLRARIYEEQKEQIAVTIACEEAVGLAVSTNERLEPLLAHNSKLLSRRSRIPFRKALFRVPAANKHADRLRTELRSVLREPVMPLLLQSSPMTAD